MKVKCGINYPTLHYTISYICRSKNYNSAYSSWQLFSQPILLPVPKHNCTYEDLYNRLLQRLGWVGWENMSLRLQCTVLQKLQSPPLFVLSFCLCDEVYRKQEVCFSVVFYRPHCHQIMGGGVLLLFSDALGL